ncbi:hypothetical protein VDG1235_1090 [Verrucomicrobiia bacterium DG1235]|nr:hypothetical protein VDG1235_1090 [Verrucomicrobiae bacterium DG1235]
MTAAMAINKGVLEGESNSEEDRFSIFRDDGALKRRFWRKTRSALGEGRNALFQELHERKNRHPSNNSNLNLTEVLIPNLLAVLFTGCSLAW